MAEQASPFQGIREAGLRRIRLSEAPAAALRQQAVNVAGLRTSGVGQLPLIEAARNRALAEAGLEEQISGQEASQLGAERLAQIQADLELRNMLAGLERQQDIANTAARRGFQRELLGAAIGIPAFALKSAIGKQFGLGGTATKAVTG